MTTEVEGTFRSERGEVARARLMASEALRRWGLDGEVAPMELAVSEVVGAAVRQGTGPVRVRLALDGPRLRLEVHHPGPRPAGPPPEPLWFVDDVADARGVTPGPGGVVTWLVRTVA